MEDVRNHIVKYAPAELEIEYSVDIYRNSIIAKLKTKENTLMKIECSILKEEGKTGHGH